MSRKEEDRVEGGVVMGACRGVHTLQAHVSDDADEESNSQWALSVRRFEEDDYGLAAGDSVPDLSVDPGDGVLSVINSSSSVHRAYHISLRGDNVRVMGANGRLLQRATNESVITFALALPPRVAVDVCAIDIARQKVEELDIASDVVDVAPPPDPPLKAPSASYGFPLKGSSFLCTQAAGGSLSHFAHASTFYAVDFRCPVGTPVVAMAAGVVEAVEVECEVSSIHVSALFAWNRLSLRLDDGAIIEHVHIAARSAVVAVGDRVETGQLLCQSGQVGFCPEPHLHLEMHLSTERDAPSLPFKLRRTGGPPAVPTAGEWWRPPPQKEAGSS